MRAIILALFTMAVVATAISRPQDRDAQTLEKYPVASPHNLAHKSAPDPDRFHTTRKSDVDLPLPGEEDAFTFAVFGDRTGGVPAGLTVTSVGSRSPLPSQ